MNNKSLHFPRLFPCGCLTMALLLGGCFLFLEMQDIDEHGYASDFNHIPGIQDEKILPPDIEFETDLFFSRIGWLNDWTLYIIGKFTSETTYCLLNKPDEIGFPIPRFRYEEEFEMDSMAWKLRNIPKDIEHSLKLTQDQENNSYYYSKIDDYIVVFYIPYKKHFQVEVSLLGKSGYFVIKINHITRH